MSTREPERRTIRDLLTSAPATVAIAATCVAAWAATALTGESTSGLHLVAAGALERGHVWAGEPWRILTAPFLHAGPFHLLWNVAGAVLIGAPLERGLGSARYLAVYFAGAVGGSTLSLLAQDAVSVGSSGALFGLIGAILAIRHRALGGWRPFLSDPPTRRLIGSLAAWNLAGLALAAAGVRLDHLAHVGGFAAGAAATWAAISPRPLPRAAAVAALLAAATAAAAWPRDRLSQVTAWELEDALSRALDDDDWARAKALVDRGRRGGLDTPFFRAAREKVEGQRHSRE